jgi:hypothetical protein
VNHDDAASAFNFARLGRQSSNAIIERLVGVKFICEVHGQVEHIEVVDGGIIVLTERGITKVSR